jgi:hypothetical protein
MVTWEALAVELDGSGSRPKLASVLGELWQQGERPRALALAAQARTDVENAVPRDEATLREITAWVAARSPPRDRP